MTPTEKTQLTLRLPKKLNEMLTVLAEQTGIAKNSLIVSALWNLANNKVSE